MQFKYQDAEHLASAVYEYSECEHSCCNKLYCAINGKRSSAAIKVTLAFPRDRGTHN